MPYMHNKPKIGILIDQLVPGGVQKSAINEAANLIKLGYKITLFILVRQIYDYQYEDLIKGLPVVYLSDYNPRLFRKAIRLPYFFFLTHLHIFNPLFVKRYTPINKYDFLISHGTTTCITAAAISQKYNIPYLAYIWDPMLFILQKVYKPTMLRYLFIFFIPLIKYIEASFLRSAALVITPSQVHQKYIHHTYNINPKVVYPGSYPSIDAIKRLDKHNSRKFILAYTRWELAKNPYFYIWLAKKIPQDVKILLAGTWTNKTEEQKFKQLISTEGLNQKITLVSPITKKDLASIASLSFVWVHSNFEALGISGLEMAALGLPIIIPEGSGLAELFQEGKHGFFPPSGNFKAFFEKIMYLYNHPKVARNIGNAAAWIAKKYTWKFHSKCVIKLVTEYLTKDKICCLSNAFVTTESIGGGDQFLIELAKHAPTSVYLTIILPQIGLVHWQRSIVHNNNIRFIVLQKNPFDGSNNVICILLTYIIRSVQTYFILKSLAPYNQLYSSSNYLPDILPIYLYKISLKNIYWSTRFFHFIQHPYVRGGSILRNLGAYLLQQIGLHLIKKTNLILIDNPSLKYKLIKLGFEAAKIHLAYGGVDYKNFSHIQPVPDNYVSDAILIGRFSEHKGIFDAIYAWKIVCNRFPQAKLILRGFGPASITRKIKGEIKRLNMKENIHIVGFVSNRYELSKYLSGSKLLLFLDREAGFGLVVCEAMASGLPVIAYKLPIFGSVYKQGYILADQNDIRIVAVRIIELLSNRKKINYYSHIAKHEAKKFDWPIISNQFYQLLNRHSHYRLA